MKVSARDFGKRPIRRRDGTGGKVVDLYPLSPEQREAISVRAAMAEQDARKRGFDFGEKEAISRHRTQPPHPQNSLVRPAKPPHVPLQAYDMGEFEGITIPDREWIVPDWLQVGSVTLLYADGGVGKSLLAMQLMTACATGGQWCGLDVALCRSVGLFCEDDIGELARRQMSINAAMGTTFADLGGQATYLSGVGEDNQLMTFARDGSNIATDRFDEIRNLAVKQRARLVIVDTAADTFGGNENDRGQVRQYVGRALTRLAQDINGAVLLNAHPSRAGLAEGGDLDGGSTAWNNSARSRWSFARNRGEGEDGNGRILAYRKGNYAKKGRTIDLRWTDGVFLPSGAVSDGGAGAADGFLLETAKHVFLALLAEFTARGVSLSSKPNSQNYAPRQFVRDDGRAGVSKRDFEKAMHALFKEGRIKIEEYGRKSDLRERIAACDMPENDEAE